MNFPSTALSLNPKQLLKQTDLLFTCGLIGTVVLLVLPVPIWLLDLLLAASIGASLLILLLIIYVKEPAEFSSFPTMLLAITLFRLALNVASTRLILLEGFGGHIIQSFGNFVVQGNYLVGAVVFFILVVINFVVITKGAGRIAEVAARFTLDAMPGKQMAIDAELNAGLIDEVSATTRRRKIQKEADFYGAMDGASKFVRGDALAGLLITAINIVGGFAIGMLQKGMPLMDALQKYTLLSIGDGLVTQVPALIISVAAGLLVTRTPDDSNLGVQVSRQLTSYPRAIGIASAILFVFAIVPGLPAIPFLILSIIAGATVYFLAKQRQRAELLPKPVPALPPKSAGGSAGGLTGGTGSSSDEFQKLIEAEIFAVELGYGLTHLADKTQGGDLLERITGVRKSFARDTGMIVPPIAVRDSLDIEANEYRFLLRGKVVGSASVVVSRWLAMNVTNSRVALNGVPTTEPVFGIPAVWIGEDEKKTAEINGYTVVDVVSVIITHLAEILKQSAHLILSRQEVQGLVNRLKETNPALVSELFPDLVTLGVVQRVLQNLLREGVSIKNLAVILEAVADFAPITKNPDDLSEQVRRRLGTYFVESYECEPRMIKGLTLEPRLEQSLIQRIQRTHFEVMLAIDPQTAQFLMQELTVRSNQMAELGLTPIVIVSSDLRLAFKRFFESSFPKLVVLSYQELPAQTEIQSVGIILVPPGVRLPVEPPQQGTPQQVAPR
jgi:flagellar biosynthesis protein FlhA